MSDAPIRELDRNSVSSLPRIPVSYDLSRELFLSNRSFIEPLGSHYVAFNPDFPGNPILLSEKTHVLLRGFQNGQSVGDALAKSSLEFSRALGYVDYFYDQGYLRPKKNSSRYSADDRLENHISNLSFWIHINNHCNLDCSYCFVNKFKSTMSDEVIEQTTSQIRSTADSRNVRNINITYAGGEPTLSFEQIKKFNAALKRKLDGSSTWVHEAVITNGTKINARLVEFIKENNCSVGISLDGYGPEFHDRHRIFRGNRAGSWHIIERNIDFLLHQGVRPYIMVVASAETCESLPDLVRWIADRKLTMRLSVVRQPDGQWHPTDWKEAYDRLIKRLIPSFESAFRALESGDYSYEWARRVRLCELHFDMPSFSTSCGIGSSHVVVQDDGMLASCPMTIRESPVLSESDLISATSKTMNISPRARNVSTEKNCLDCQWFPVCVSGCPVTNERVKGTPFTISPMHDFYAYVIPRFVKFLGTKLLQAAEKEGSAASHLIDEGALSDLGLQGYSCKEEMTHGH